MKMRISVGVVASAIATAVGCHNWADRIVVDTGTPGPRLFAWVPDSTAILAHEGVSGFADPTGAVLTDSASWAAAWDKIHAGRQPQPPCPNVDFDRYRVVLVGLGSRGSSGFDIRVDSVVTYEMGPIVYLLATAPGATCVTAAVITAPVEALRLPLFSSIGFRRRDAVLECP